MSDVPGHPQAGVESFRSSQKTGNRRGRDDKGHFRKFCAWGSGIWPKRTRSSRTYGIRCNRCCSNLYARRWNPVRTAKRSACHAFARAGRPAACSECAAGAAGRHAVAARQGSPEVACAQRSTQNAHRTKAAAGTRACSANPCTPRASRPGRALAQTCRRRSCARRIFARHPDVACAGQRDPA